MKKLIYLLVLTLTASGFYSCQKPSDLQDPQNITKTNLVKSMNDLVVNPNFDWKTTKTLDVSINLPGGAEQQKLFIQSQDGKRTYFVGYSADKSAHLKTRITIPAYENMLKVSIGKANDNGAVLVGVDNKSLSYTFSGNKSTTVVCAACNGQISWLKLKYTGGENNPLIKVTQHSTGGGNTETTIFEEHVTQNGTFSFYGINNGQRMGSKIHVYVNGNHNVDIHTSCSQTILAGMQFGNFLIVGGESVNGGPICSVGNTPPVAVFTASATCLPTNTDFSFDASGVTDAEDASADLEVRWDFGDGIWTSWTTVKTASYQYSSQGTFNVKMEVKDTQGLTDIISHPLTVDNNACGGTSMNYTGTLAYEDLWPWKGDYDFNDLVINYDFELTKNISEKIVHIKATFIIYVFGAGYYNGFGFTLPNVSPNQVNSVSGSSLKGNSIINLASNGLEAGQSKATVVVYDDSFDQMQHPGVGIGVNTDPNAPYVSPKTLTIEMDFMDNGVVPAGGAVTFSQLDIGNFNPFIIVNQERGVEVHLPGLAPSDLADASLFTVGDDDSNPVDNRYYLTGSNLPWAINLPTVFEYPIEKQDITQVYLHFAEWAESSGQLYPDWYLDIPGYRNSSLIYTHN